MFVVDFQFFKSFLESVEVVAAMFDLLLVVSQFVLQLLDSVFENLLLRLGILGFLLLLQDDPLDILTEAAL